MWRELFEVAGRQHQVVHVRQAPLCGIPPRTFYDRAEAEGWPELERGVRLLPGVAPTWWSQASAALLAAGDRAALTGTSALFVHGVLDDPPLGVHVAVPADRARPSLRHATDIVRTTSLLARDVTDSLDLRVVSAAWGLLHAGRTESERRVLALTISAGQRERLVRGALEDVLNRAGTAKGRRALRLAYQATVTDLVDSVLELDCRRSIRRLGFAPYPSPFPFRCPDGRVIHLDVPFPEIWFAYEVDSPASRAGGGAFRTDRKRWGEAQKGGWRIAWLTRERIGDDPGGVAEELAGAFAAADPERPPPRPSPCRRRSCRVCLDLRTNLNG